MLFLLRRGLVPQTAEMDGGPEQTMITSGSCFARKVPGLCSVSICRNITNKPPQCWRWGNRAEHALPRDPAVQGDGLGSSLGGSGCYR